MGSRQNMCAILFCFFFWLFFFCFIFFRSWEKQKKKIVVDEDSGKRVDPTCCICLIRFCKTKMFFHPRKEGHRCRRNRMDDGPFCFPFNPLHIFFFIKAKKKSKFLLSRTEEWQKERKKKGKSSGVISNFYVCLFCALMFENEGNWKTIKNFSVKTIFFLMSLTFRLLYNSRSSSSRLQRRQNNHLCVCTKKNKKKIHCKTNKIRKKKSNKLCLNS